MKTIISSRVISACFSAIISTIGLISSVTAPVYAEDVELFANLIDNPLATGGETANQPNVLFILDTSGSMQFLLASSDRPAYIPTINYGSSPENNVYVYTSDLVFTGNFLPNVNNFCAAANDFFAVNEDFPEFFGRTAVWESIAATNASAAFGGWLSNASDSVNIQGLECELDNGIDGRAGPTDPYPAQVDNNNPGDLTTPNYTSDATSARNLDWDGGQFPSRILVPSNYHDYLNLTPLEVTNLNAGVAQNNIPTDATQVAYSGATPATASLINDQATAVCEGLDGGFNSTVGDNAVVIVNTITNQADQTFTCQSRLSVLQSSATSLLRSITGVNIGLMRFNENQGGNDNGGTLLNRVFDIDGNNGQNRMDLIDEINNLVADGATPLEETLFEAYNYFAGRAPEFGDEGLIVSNGAGGTNDSISSQERDNQAIIGAGTNERYISPIESQCQDNSVVLFTDGVPTQDDDSEQDIVSDLGLGGSACGGLGFRNIRGSNVFGTDGRFTNGSCLDEIAAFMSAEDAEVNTTIDDPTRVYTYTISFGAEEGSDQSVLLTAAANAGLRTGAVAGDQSFDANDSGALSSAFRSILQDIGDVESGSFSSPTVTVNSFNRLESNDEVYFSLFEPGNSSRWDGNIKSYRLGVQNGEVVILDARTPPQVAVDPITGEFDDQAQSIWSNQADGAVVTSGGFANELDVADVDRRRELFLSLDSNSTNLELLTTDDDNDTTAVDNVVDIANGPNNILGDADDVSFGANPINDETNLRAIAGWTLGRDVDDERGDGAAAANFFVGDSLHSSPVVVNFGDGQDVNDSVVFAATNQGIIHAIEANPDSGEELWAYVPDPSLLENLGTYFNDPLTGTVPHLYGVDGSFVVDEERNAVTNDFISANIFVGQRRGGSKYFAFNVNNSAPSTNNATTPVGTGGTAANGTGDQPLTKLWTLEDLPQMGQSWATPIPATVNYCETGVCGPRDVFFISGGYDTAYDQQDAELDSLAGNVNGNAIYMIDNQDSDDDGVLDADVIETTGPRAGQPRLLWMAGATGEVDNNNRDFSDPEMTHAFPSAPVVIDISGDGFTDLLFATDIAGRVWRIDFRGGFGEDANGQIVFDANDIDSQNNNDANDREVNGGIIADLSTNLTNRRFYNRPSVSISEASGETPNESSRFNIAFGSGYRAHLTLDEAEENNDENNRLYVVFDRNVTSIPLNFDAAGVPEDVSYDIDEDNSQIVANDIGAVSTTGLDLSGTNRNGFFVDLASTSEKIIEPVITFSNSVVGTTYIPDEPQTLIGSNVVCSQGLGTATAFQVNLSTGDFSSTPLTVPGPSSSPAIVSLLDANGDRVEAVAFGPQFIPIDDVVGDEPAGITTDSIEADRREIGTVDKLFWLEREE